MPRRVPDHERLADLRRLARLKRYATIRDRIRAVILTREGLQQKAIARKLDRTEAWVHRWVGRYIDQGIEGLRDRPRSGQPTKLAREDEEAFLERLRQGPSPHDRVSTWRGQDIQRMLAAEFDADYTLGGVYVLLARLGLSWLCARPRHPKNDPEAMGAWKRGVPPLSRR